MREDFLIFGNPIIEQPEIDEVIASLKTGWLSTGPKVHRFEKMFGEYKGAAFSVALNSCTAALHLSMLALGIRPGDEVILPSLTFAATANAVICAGATPVLADCGKRTINMEAAYEKNIG
jgi:dTDP-4-amino-4,6-dideoxygalactose transaminase